MLTPFTGLIVAISITGKPNQAEIERMAASIVATSKLIDASLDGLPSIENKELEQLDRIAQLEAENKRYEEEILQLVVLARTFLSMLLPRISFLSYLLLNSILRIQISQREDVTEPNSAGSARSCGWIMIVPVLRIPRSACSILYHFV